MAARYAARAASSRAVVSVPQRTHVTLAITFHGHVEEWSAAGLVHLHAGQLHNLARKVRRFVQGI
jgi:hypothetical protein